MQHADQIDHGIHPGDALRQLHRVVHVAWDHVHRRQHDQILARALIRQVVNDRVRQAKVAPALGKTLAIVLTGDRHQSLLNEAVRLAAEAVRDNADMIAVN
jgi:uncharacterized membrane-anchored protein YjiN (DUF445 family)